MSKILIELRKNDTVFVLIKLNEAGGILGEVEVSLGKLRHPIHKHRALPLADLEAFTEALQTLADLGTVEAPSETSKGTGSPKPSKVTKKAGRRGAKGSDGDADTGSSDSSVQPDPEPTDS